MARLAGVDLPAKKRTEIGLTYIYGIGRTRAKSLCYRAHVDPNKKVSELTEDEINHIRQILEAEGSVEGDLDEHQAPDRDGFVSRHAAPPRPARARPAHAHQCAHPQGSAARHRGE